jgi:hypothetical protein
MWPVIFEYLLAGTVAAERRCGLNETCKFKARLHQCVCICTATRRHVQLFKCPPQVGLCSHIIHMLLMFLYHKLSPSGCAQLACTLSYYNQLNKQKWMNQNQTFLDIETRPKHSLPTRFNSTKQNPSSGSNYTSQQGFGNMIENLLLTLTETCWLQIWN